MDGIGNLQRNVIAFLSQSASYGVSDAVEIHETHGSLVFLAGQHAFKLKREVKYPYMDYSTPERRWRMCERELAVNRRMAPALYEKVVSVVDEGRTLRFGSADDPHAVDWLVVMRRFDQSDLLEARRKAGKLTRDDMLSLADAIANFHHDAEVVKEFGGASGLRAVVDENVAILSEMCAKTSLASAVQQYRTLSQDWLLRTRDVLGWRRQSGFVRRCHGDLHLNNVCVIGGSPVLFDAIEFNDAFSCIDVFYDLAFVLMDLDWHGLRTHANAVLNRYLERTHDYSGLSALPLFLSCRAAIRAHVALSTLQNASAGSADAGAPGRLIQAANAYLELRKPELIAIGGVSGTGKSTLARLLSPAIGAAPGAVFLRSDVIRKSLMGVAETERLPATAYDRRTNLSVYERLLEKASAILKAGHSVVVDAVFSQATEQARIEAVARSSGVDFHGLWLAAPKEVLEQRILQRSGDASDATVAVLRNQIAAVSEPAHWPRVQAEGTPRQVLALAERLVGRGAKMAV
jgi:uncharacterized protein